MLTAVCKTRVAHGSLSHEVGGFLKYPPHACSCHDLMWFPSGRCLWSSAQEVWWTSVLPVFSRVLSTTAQSYTKSLSLATVTSAWRGPRSRTSPLVLVVGLLHPRLSIVDLSFLNVCCNSSVLLLFLLAFISFSKLFLPISFTIHCVFLFVPANDNCDDAFVDTERETIFFNSQQVSKPESSCDLTSVSNNWGITRTHAL